MLFKSTSQSLVSLRIPGLIFLCGFLLNFSLSDGASHCHVPTFIQDDKENIGNQDDQKHSPKVNLADATVSELIDHLTEVSAEGVGFHATAWSSGFIAIEHEPDFQGGVLGSNKPVASPVMVELVRRGADALPALIEHLQDKRLTNLSVGGGIISAAWYAEEYDGRDRTKTEEELEDRIEDGPAAPTIYRVRVGDLCFVAIGQIVNRQLSAVRYQPSGCMVINSPIQSKELADAVKRDWAGVKHEQLKKIQLDDCLKTQPNGDWGAWQRLRVYYPETAEENAIKLLRRPVYDQDDLWDFLSDNLVKEKDPEKWRPMIDAYVNSKGKHVEEVLPFWLHWIFFRTHFEKTAEFVADGEIAKKILAKLYPEFKPGKRGFLNAAEIEDLSYGVSITNGFSSAKIDQVVCDLFLSASDGKYKGIRKYDVDNLAQACLERLCSSNYQVDGQPDFLFKQIDKLVNDSAHEVSGMRYTAMQMALKYFPERSGELFGRFVSENEELGDIAKFNLLEEPTKPQPYMIEFLTKRLDDKSVGGAGFASPGSYGPPWDNHHIRICDLAAKVLADYYLPKFVRFEYEGNPEFLDQQISKIRRILAGEKDIEFGPPPRPQMPEQIASRQARLTIELDREFGRPYAFSTDQQIWFGDGFEGRGGWAYDTLEYNLKERKVVDRKPLDQWNGGVNIIDNGRPDRAFCYHGYEGGHVFIRELPSGRELKKVATPFHSGVQFNDPLQVRNLSDVTICGKQSEWLLALTQDLKLHSVDLRTAEHQVEWQYELKMRRRAFGAKIIGLENSNKAILQNVGDKFPDSPLQIWDQSKREVVVANKLPTNKWEAGWGNLAWNGLYGNTVWNLETLTILPIPESKEPIQSITCDGDQTTLFVLRGGAIDVMRIKDERTLTPIQRLNSPVISKLADIRLVVSYDEKHLFVHGWHVVENEDGNYERGKVALLVFDVADLTQ